jgi:hypothetical protein
MSFLTDFERKSSVWEKLVAHYSEKLAKARQRLENPDIDERERIKLCWQIDTIKSLLALGEQDSKDVAGAGR